MNDMDIKLVRLIQDDNIPFGKCEIVGVRIRDVESDEELGRELRTVEVRCCGSTLVRLKIDIEADPTMELAND